MVAERASTLNHATSSIELKPTSEITTHHRFLSSKVGDFLNEIERSGLVGQAFPPAGLYYLGKRLACPYKFDDANGADGKSQSAEFA